MSRVKWSRWTMRSALLMTAVLGGCAFDGPRSAFEPNGPVAQIQLDLFELTFWLAMVVLAVVGGLLIYVVWRFPDKGDKQGIPEQVHGNTRLEITWTLIPVIILIIIAIPTVRDVFKTESYIEPGEQTLEVTVTGHQWWWAFEYPEQGVVTANELHVPVGRRVVLNLRSADVIHSFWVPRLAGKRDLIPNQDNQLWFIASDPGVYYGHCAEFCLGPHAYMRFRVIAHEQEEFDAWVAAFQNAGQTQQAAADPQVQAGAQHFQQICASCHAIRGVAEGRVGPDLTNFGLRHTIAAGVLENTPENLAAWIKDPQAIKPGNYMPNLGLDDETVAALVAYLESLGTETRQAAQLR